MMSAKSPWQMSLTEAVTDPKELFELLALPLELLPKAQEAVQLFGLKVPREFLARMEIGNLADPLLRQVLPLGAELEVVPGYSADPLQESEFNPVPGVLHKYHGRVLLTIAGACTVNCRYCFRRHFPYEKNLPGMVALPPVLDYLKQHTEVHEVILSGGDPLVVSDTYLAQVVQAIAAIPHIKTLRFHTRLPVMIPNRITETLLEMLKQTRLQVVWVLHCNHAQEMDADVRQALEKLRAVPVQLLNQSVLLKGVNDTVPALVNLSHALFSAGVLPYYLHLLDPVQGAAHFAVSDEKAKQLMQEIRVQLPGYLVPRLAREEPGQPSKTLIGSPD